MIIPRVVLCSQARSGSSMMMRLLQAGGLTVDFSPETDQAKAFYRNPYGLFENRAGILAGQFVNSFKLLDPTQFTNVPTDYKIIFIQRNLTAILASWQEIATRGTAEGRDLTAWLASVIALANTNKTAWATILAANPTVLVLDYNTVCSNPNIAAQTIANYLNTSTFTFDTQAAAATIDTTLFVNRG